jgi:hypothetical protein
MIARIDFQLKCLHVASGAIHVPETFELEEVIYGDGADNGAGKSGRRTFPPDLAFTQSRLH